MNKIRRFLSQASLVLFIALAFLSVIPAQTAEAYAFSDRCWGGWGGESCTYFDNTRYFTPTYYGYHTTNYVLTTGAHMTDVETLINTLGAYAYGPTGTYVERQNQAGAAFIIQSMLGRNGGQANSAGGRNVPVADFNALATRLRLANINFDAIVCSNGVNTMAGASRGGARFDVMRVNIAAQANKCEEGIAITDSDGNEYNIFDRCANPVGRLDGVLRTEDFNLTPSISVSPRTSESATSVSPTGSVTNSGETASRDAQWQLSTFIISPGAEIPQPSEYISGAAPGAFYGNGARVIQSGNRAFPTGPTGVSLNTQVLGNHQVGSQVCYALSVQPFRHDDGRWHHSRPACVTISKFPKVQVTGGDLIVGRGSANNPGAVSNIRTSTSVMASGVTYGSWAEYAIIPSGVVTGMASSAGYAGGASASPNLCRVSVLTFANASSPSCSGSSAIGRYAHSTTVPNIAARFPVTSDTPRVKGMTANLQDDNLSGVYTSTNRTLTVAGSGDIQAGRWIVINAPTTDVIITGDIRYTTQAISEANRIPQVVIIAQNIIISDEVQNVDAWLIATGSGVNGRINTCGATGSRSTTGVGEATRLTAGVCGNKLTVNGPISANHLIMRRTAGAGPGEQSGEPAEVFNLRADAFIWASNYNSGTGRLPTVMTTELPPRF